MTATPKNEIFNKKINKSEIKKIQELIDNALIPTTQKRDFKKLSISKINIWVLIFNPLMPTKKKDLKKEKKYVSKKKSH